MIVIVEDAKKRICKCFNENKIQLVKLLNVKVTNKGIFQGVIPYQLIEYFSNHNSPITLPKLGICIILSVADAFGSFDP